MVIGYMLLMNKGVLIMTVKSIINSNGQIAIPDKMLKKLNIKQGDILELTATDNLIVIEKYEGEVIECVN